MGLRHAATVVAMSVNCRPKAASVAVESMVTSRGLNSPLERTTSALLILDTTQKAAIAEGPEGPEGPERPAGSPGAVE